MALQLGVLRDALVEAGASADSARRASEEVASYESRLAGIEARLTTQTWMIGVLLALALAGLGGQAAIWLQIVSLTRATAT